MKVTKDIHLVPGKGFDSNMYIIIDKEARLTLVDTGHSDHDKDHNYLLEYINKIGYSGTDIENIVLTHVHVDHSGGLSSLVKNFRPEVYVFEDGADYIENGDLRMTLAGMFLGFFDATPVDYRLREKEKITFGSHEFIVYNTPGHTSCSICMYDEEKNCETSDST